jgi:hypothetical protein
MDRRTIKAGPRVPYDARVVCREERHPESHHPCRPGSGGIEPDHQAPRTPTLSGHQRHQRRQVVTLLPVARHSLAGDDKGGDMP